ncbi:hypothetical protein GOL98_33460, partial [Streptomyces sp. Z38]|nr:hypothetical protein [Streptomyces sp. Z38]
MTDETTEPAVDAPEAAPEEPAQPLGLGKAGLGLPAPARREHSGPRRPGDRRRHGRGGGGLVHR